MKLVNTIITLSWLTVTSAICIVLFITLPISFPSFNKLKWPSNPDTNDILPNVSYAYEKLLEPGEGIEAVERQCLGCHSARLITQNRMSRERWEDNIKWMQETQGLWDLGKDHKTVIDYLTTYYAPQKVGRRSNLNETALEWYRLDESPNQSPNFN